MATRAGSVEWHLLEALASGSAYAYAIDDPLNFIDPLGTRPWLVEAVRKELQRRIDIATGAKGTAIAEARQRHLSYSEYNAYVHARASQIIACELSVVDAIVAATLQEDISAFDYVRRFCEAAKTGAALPSLSEQYVDTLVDLWNDVQGLSGYLPEQLAADGRLLGTDGRALSPGSMGRRPE